MRRIIKNILLRIDNGITRRFVLWLWPQYRTSSENYMAFYQVLKLFFHGSDILGDLVRECRDGLEHDDAKYAPVLAELDSIVPAQDGDDTAEAEIDFQPAPLSFDLDLGGDGA